MAHTSDVGLIAPGMYHFVRMEGETGTRFHLRVDPDGGGLLLANAAASAQLSPTGMFMADRVLRGRDDAEIVAEGTAVLAGASHAQIAGDLARVRELMARVSAAGPTQRVPTASGGDGRRLAAPYQATVTQADCATLEPILRKLWDIGVPQVTLLAQPDQDPALLQWLVQCAEDMGMICGIRCVASWLVEDVIRDAAQAGLDYLACVYASCDPAEHNLMVGAEDHAVVARAFELCRELDLAPVAQVPLTDESVDELEGIVECVTGLGAKALSVFALACPDEDAEADAAGALPARTLPQVATVVMEAAEEANVLMVWEAPVRFDAAQSLPAHVARGPRAMGDVTIRVEPDGSVFPGRGPRQCVGNLLAQDWKDIWDSDCFTRFRDSVAEPGRCSTCPGLEVCEMGCVKDPANWSDDMREGDVR